MISLSKMALSTVCALTISAQCYIFPASAETVLRVAMTAADIPSTTGQPDQGSEGLRFTGDTIFDSLVRWDLTSTSKPSPLVSGLAESWTVDLSDKKRWTFTLRPNVEFHDGTVWTAAVAVWNFDKLLKQDAPQYDARQVGLSYGALQGVESYRAVDDLTFEVVTKEPDALLPYYLTVIYFASPAQWDKVGGNWDAFAAAPVGTGPWRLVSLIPRERLELAAFDKHWNSDRIPEIDRLVLLPVPDATTRSAALLSGQVDWIEAPSPDVIPRLQQQGMKISAGPYPHVWPWMFNVNADAPTSDVRVRRALNLAVDREAVVSLLGGLAYPAAGAVVKESPWWGNPEFQVKYDPEEAKRLLADAGYGPSNPLQFKVLITASGSGQMLPVPMNEYLQQALSDIGVKVEFEVLEWNTSFRARRNLGLAAPENAGVGAINNSWAMTDPYFGFIMALSSSAVRPNGFNFGGINDEVIDKLSQEIRVTFDPAEQDRLIAELHARMVDQAYWLFVVHDAQPRAMSPNVADFTPAQSWRQDLARVRLAP